MTQPDDRELEQYLEGGSKLSRRYRDASAESAPPELDAAILARARAELKRKPPSLNRLLAPVALAASLVLGVNLAWNLYQVEPVPAGLEAPAAKSQSRDDGFVASPPPPPTVAQSAARQRKAPAAEAPAPEEKATAETDALERRQAELAQQREQEALSKRESEGRLEERLASSPRRAEAPQSPSFAADEPAAGAAAPQSRAMADAAAPLSEPQKIDRLIAYIGNLQGAVFIRNDKEYGPAEAAKHLQLKREKAGDRVKIAEDFIRLCASHSSMSGEAYLIRFADGRTRTAEDVLREELARLEAAR